MSPFLSIITICFNEADKILKTCQSVAEQTFRDFEWIVIDGGSTDGTVDILESHRSVISHLVSERDKGIYNAMNKGIRLAKGRYFLFLNGGDSFCEPTILEQALQPFKNEMHQPDLIYGEMLNEQTGEYIRYLGNKKINLDFFAHCHTLHHQATFIKGDLFKVYGLYDESYRIAGDFEWWLRYFKDNAKPDLAYIPFNISYFNTEGISFNPKNRKKLLNEVTRALIQNNADQSWRRFFVVIKFYYNMYLRIFVNLAYLEIIKILIFLGIKDPVRDFYRKYIKAKEA